MILILGGTGFIGQAIHAAVQRMGLQSEIVSRRNVDYSDPRTLAAFLRERRPEFLISTAGYVGRPNIDACEHNKIDCLTANTVLPGNIRTVCEQERIPWGYVSSGCIFTGSKEGQEGFTEEDRPNFTFRQNNCSFYSGCKALAEEILQGAEQCYIWRPRMPFSHRNSPRNYISKILVYDKLLEARNSLTCLEEFADACVACWMRRTPYGVYNLTNPGSVTTKEIVGMIQRYKVSTKQFTFFDSEEQFMQLAARAPRSNCILSSDNAISMGLKLTEVHMALEIALGNWR